MKVILYGEEKMYTFKSIVSAEQLKKKSKIQGFRDIRFTNCTITIQNKEHNFPWS